MPQLSTTRPVAVVTGGRQGLGLATVRALAARGFDVAIGDIAEADHATQGIIDELARLGATARYYRLDIADLDGHHGFVNRVWADFGRLDCLHNNAGIAARPLTDVLDLAPEAFDRAVDVNLRGTFFLSQAVARSMLADNARHTDGIYRSILVVSSIAAEMVSTNRSQYCITKAGLSMLTKILAVRLGAERIHVHEIRPGFIRSDMTASAGTTEIDEWIGQGRMPVPRWGEADDVGQAVASLAAGAVPYSTGQPFWVAGGLNVMQAT
jgi:3-oxoacyl-[acyl-carrier protein] reductase